MWLAIDQKDDKQYEMELKYKKKCVQQIQLNWSTRTVGALDFHTGGYIAYYKFHCSLVRCVSFFSEFLCCCCCFFLLLGTFCMSACQNTRTNFRSIVCALKNKMINRI